MSEKLPSHSTETITCIYSGSGVDQCLNGKDTDASVPKKEIINKSQGFLKNLKKLLSGNQEEKVKNIEDTTGEKEKKEVIKNPDFKETQDYDDFSGLIDRLASQNPNIRSLLTNYGVIFNNNQIYVDGKIWTHSLSNKPINIEYDREQNHVTISKVSKDGAIVGTSINIYFNPLRTDRIRFVTDIYGKKIFEYIKHNNDEPENFIYEVDNESLLKYGVDYETQIKNSQ